MSMYDCLETSAVQIAVAGFMLALVAASIAVPIACYETAVAKDALARGLVEGAVPGQLGTHWVKPAVEPERVTP